MRRSRWSAICGMVAVALSLAACTAPTPVESVAKAPAASSRATPAGFTVVASGDILLHPEVTAQAKADGGGARRDYDRILAGVAPAVSGADLALCHLETPVAPAGGPFTGYPRFSVPPEITTAIAHTGYDSCSTASNHTLDEGVTGVRRTLNALDRAGVAHTGSARSPAEAARPLILNADGVRVAQLSYAFGFNGFELPAGKPWLANRIDPTRIINAARRARAAGAQVVIVSMHWGTEDQQRVTGEQRRLARRLLADDSIDLIVGHHAHVVQPFQRIHGKWVAYGMGNLVARHDDPLGITEEGVLARFHFTRAGTRWTVDRAEYLPTLVDFGPPLRVIDLTGPSAAGVPATRRAEALRRTDSVVLSLGAAGNGLSRVGS